MEDKTGLSTLNDWPKYLLVFGVALCLGIGIGHYQENILWGMLGAFGLFCILLLTWRYERFPIYALIVMIPLAEIYRLDILPTTLLVIPGGLALFGVLLNLWRSSSRLFLGSGATLIALLLCFWVTVSTGIIGSPGESRPYWLVFVLLWLIPNYIKKEEHVLLALRLVVIPLAFIGYYVFLDRSIVFSLNPGVSMDDLHNSNYVVGGKNTVGLWLTIGVAIVYFLLDYPKNNNWERWALVLAGAGMVLGIFGTLSIGAAIGLAVVGAGVILLRPSHISRLRLILPAILLAIFVLTGPLSERLGNQDLTTIDGDWGTNRGELWSAGIQTIAEFPVFGIGLSPDRRIELVKYVQSWFIQNWYEIGIVVVPHNMLLSVGIEIGIPGLLLYMALILAILFSVFRIRFLEIYRTSPIICLLTDLFLVALMTALVQGQALSVHLDKLIWLLLGFGIALNRIAKNTEIQVSQ